MDTWVHLNKLTLWRAIVIRYCTYACRLLLVTCAGLNFPSPHFLLCLKVLERVLFIVKKILLFGLAFDIFYLSLHKLHPNTTIRYLLLLHRGALVLSLIAEHAMCLHLLHIRRLNYHWWEHTFVEYRALSSAIGLIRDGYEISLVLKTDLCQIISSTGVFSIFEVLLGAYTTLELLHRRYPAVFWDTVYFTCDTVQRLVQLQRKDLRVGITAILGLMSATAEYKKVLDPKLDLDPLF